MVIGGITDFVVDTVVKKAIPQLISLFIPGAGFITAIIKIYDTVMVFVQKISRIIQVVTAFVDSIVRIAAGDIAAAANKVESVLAGLLSLAINFLAGFVGLGRVADKVMGVLRRVQATVDKALDKLVEWIVGTARRLGRLVARGAAPPDQRTPAEKAAALSAAVGEAQGLLAANTATPETIRRALPALKAKYRLTAAVLEEVAPNEYDIALEINPRAKTNRKKFDPTTIKVGDVIRVRFQTPESARAGFLDNRSTFDGRRYRYVPADVTGVQGTTISYRTQRDAVGGAVDVAGFQTTWIRLQPGTSYAINEAWQKIKDLNVWTNFADARQVLNWRHHNSFPNPSGMQWEHIVEQSGGGAHSVDNLALTSEALNQSFNLYFGSPQEGTGRVTLRAYLRDKPQTFHRWWKERCYGVFRVRIVRKSVGADGQARGEYQTLE